MLSHSVEFFGRSLQSTTTTMTPGGVLATGSEARATTFRNDDDDDDDDDSGYGTSRLHTQGLGRSLLTSDGKVGSKGRRDDRMSTSPVSQCTLSPCLSSLAVSTLLRYNALVDPQISEAVASDLMEMGPLGFLTCVSLGQRRQRRPATGAAVLASRPRQSDSDSPAPCPRTLQSSRSCALKILSTSKGSTP